MSRAQTLRRSRGRVRVVQRVVPSFTAACASCENSRMDNPCGVFQRLLKLRQRLDGRRLSSPTPRTAKTDLNLYFWPRSHVAFTCIGVAHRFAFRGVSAPRPLTALTALFHATHRSDQLSSPEQPQLQRAP
jgi:Zn-dependent alcohol dehydrogenase